MTSNEHAEAACRLFDAERSGTQIDLISQRWLGMTLDDAYAVQAELVTRKLAAGGKRIGWKVGLTSRAMQEALNITTPDSGVLFADMLFADGATIPDGRFIQPRIEAEIAFCMAQDLAGAYVTGQQVLAATQWLAPAIEILDTRIVRRDSQGNMRTVCDTVSDNAANAGLILGTQRHAPDAVDRCFTGAIVSRDGVIEETGLAAGVLGDPAVSVAWLIQRLAHYGLGLSAGDIVLSGSFIRPVECPPGAMISADFGTFGQVTCKFAGSAHASAS